MRIGFSLKSRGMREYEAFGTLAKNTGGNRMKSGAMAAEAIIGVLVPGADGFAAERFQKLGASQIHAKLLGMEMTDKVHWGDVFGPKGHLKSYSGGLEEAG